MSHYDYIITGAGAAGLSLICRILDSDILSHKKILLIDKAPKTTNDRTWCFWEKEEGLFESIIFRKWKELNFESNAGSLALELGSYEYKMIRGIDFYNYCFQKIKQHANVDIQYGNLSFKTTSNSQTDIYIDDRLLQTGKAIVFNSVYHGSNTAGKTIHMIQHFKGWIIETSQDCFDKGKGTLMDFRVAQNRGASFVYVLPFEKNKALIEYTLFTEQLLEQHEYDTELSNYISSILKIGDYSVVDTEFGSIPMTNARFPFFQSGLYHIGTAGGQTKASTGYTFQFIQKQAAAIVDCLEKNQNLNLLAAAKKRFQFYDSVLLRLLADREPPAHEIFTRLFSRNKASLIFKFLDNETKLADEWRIIQSLQTLPFLKSAIRQFS